MEYIVTIFKDRFDTGTDTRFITESWDDFASTLRKLSDRRLDKKEDATLMSPADYPKGTTRANANVAKWAGWCAIDVDEWVPEANMKDELREKIPDWKYVCYSTASSTEEHPKFRLVFDLSRDVMKDEIRGFWYALNRELCDLADIQTKDQARMFYAPGMVGDHNFFFEEEGCTLDVDKLIAKYPYDKSADSKSFVDRLPEDVKEKVINYRKDQLINLNYKWSGYNDCPFWPVRLADEYRSISDSGWYHKMYQIMVAVAGHAIYKGYPITSMEIANLCREFDARNGNWYKDRPLDVEADRALEFIYKNKL